MLHRHSLVKAVAAVLTGSLMLAGCGGAATPTAPSGNGTETKAPEEPKVLTLYTSFSADLYNELAAAFEKETGIRVDIVTAGTGEMLRRIDSEKAAPQGDVMLGGGAESFEAFRDNFEPYQVKDDSLVPDAYKAEDRLWYGFNSLPMVLIYNKNLVPEHEVPKRWSDLLDPKWEGKIAMADATKSGTSFVQVVTMLSIYGKEDGKGWDQVKGVVKNAKILGSSSMPLKGVNDGEYHIGLTYEQGAYKYQKAGGPVGFVYPEDGTATIPDAAAIIKGAKHPQNARLFMDWLFTKETQELAAKLGLRPVRTDAAPPEGLAPANAVNLIRLDIEWVSKNRNQILETWKDIITQ